MKKKKKYILEDMSKEQLASAHDAQSNHSESPPQFKLSNKSSSEKPVQAMFGNSQMMGLGTGFPDVGKTPAAPAPVPIPYPNIAQIGSSLPGLGKQLTGGLASLSKSGAGSLSSFSGKSKDYVNAVKYAKDMFGFSAVFRNIMINGITAIGAPGCLDGPKLESFIKFSPSTASMTGNDAKMRNAIAKGVSNNFEMWKQNLMVPGLPWYPSFMNWPGPHAPPTPNVPTLLATCVSSGTTKITLVKEIKSSIKSNLPSDLKTSETDAFLESLSTQIAHMFGHWLYAKVVSNVLGKGPVPSYAPPAVNSGPVVAGDVIPTPGHLA